MATSLPERPNLEQLRKRAREVQRQTGERLHAAQLALAREYGFASWPRLAAHVATLAELTWTAPAPPAGEPPALRAVRLGCLTFGDAPVDPGAAAGLLAVAGDEGLRSDPSVAAAAADADAVRAALAAGADPDAPCGPFGWPALMYLTYSRIPAGREQTVAAARVLLDAGADPNAGRYFAGYPTPFTVLTGIFGAGERDEPPHPHEDALARLLLDAGADPNDGQTLYNRQFGPDDLFLHVLFDFGLGTGDGGPWRRRLPDLTPAPDVLVRTLLAWAVVHDQRERVALLGAHGVDLAAPLPGLDRTPHAAALVNGHRELAAALPAGSLPGSATADPVDALVGAALAGDADEVAAAPPEVVAAARRARPGLVVWAAAAGHGDAVGVLVGAGWDVDALGRGDAPIEQRWQTALHTAVERDEPALVARLLALGAGTDVRDRRFDATPADWARFFGREHLLAVLDAG